jgi:NADPH2:quinone reductase
MKAAWYSANGEARDVMVVGDLPTPEPGPGEVRVRLRTSGVNPSDVKSRQRRPVAGERIVPHSDGGGVIEAIGPGVSQRRMGERVWIWNGQWQRALGTAAQCVVLPQDQAVRLPDNAGFDVAACLGIPALTALHAVNCAGELRGRSVLVTGAGSAVGHYVTQLARMRGATVIGTAGSPQRAAHARAAGADHVIDYRNEPVAARVRELTVGLGADVVIDMDFSSTARLIGDGLLRSHGRLICYGSNDSGVLPIDFRTLLWSSISLHFFLVYDLLPAERQRAIEELDALLVRDRLLHTIAARLALEDVAKAHEMVEAGDRIGKVLLEL